MAFTFSEPAPDASLVVFRVDCPDDTGGRLALLGGVGIGNWNPLAARLGINHPQNSCEYHLLRIANNTVIYWSKIACLKI